MWSIHCLPLNNSLVVAQKQQNGQKNACGHTPIKLHFLKQAMDCILLNRELNEYENKMC